MNLLTKSALIGFAIGSIPFLVWMILRDSSALPAIQQVANYLLLPGLMVGLAISRGGVHDVNLAVVLIASCIFYSALSYVIFRIREKGETRT